MANPLPFVDKNGKTLTMGQRVRFSVATHYVNTCEGTGTVTGFGPYGTVEIESDTPIAMGNPVKMTKKVGVHCDYDGRARALKAYHAMYLDGFATSAAWVEIVEAKKARSR